MRKQILVSILALSLLAGTEAAVYTYGGPAYAIPDGNLNGVSSTIAVSGQISALADVQVTLNISGGYNGDLYAYLSYGGALVPLVNRIGMGTGNVFGSSGAGMSVTLSDSGSLGDIHLAGNGVL